MVQSVLKKTFFLFQNRGYGYAGRAVAVFAVSDTHLSTPQILNAALAVIAHNPGEDRRLAANREDGERARLVTAESGMGEAIFIAKEINRLAGGIGMLEAHELSGAVRTEGRVRGFDEIAILYRTNHQGDLLEKCLKKEGIPYIVAGRGSFLQEEKVRGSICFFRYLDTVSYTHLDVYKRQIYL